MKKFAVLVLALVIIGLAMPCYATSGRYGMQVSQPITTDGIVTDQNGNTMDYGVWVYGIKIFTSGGNSVMGVYDCDTTTELFGGSVYAKDEIGEATAYDTNESLYNTPLYFSDGVGAIIGGTGAVGWVYYGPQP